MNNDALFEQLLDYLSSIDYIRAGEIPNIDLYMDQVTTFMNEHLDKCRRYEDDKILTKTMINNYSKNDLLPPPVKKKYSKEHILFLIFIYYFKNILSISDIQSLLSPLTEKYFHTDHELQLDRIYNDVFSLERDQIEILKKDLIREYETASQTFSDAPEEDQPFLQYFSLSVC